MPQPNVLMICVDHWPGPLMAGPGMERILTPTRCEFARNGVTFTNAYSSTPTCIPARRALMTGTSAKTHGDRIFNQTLPMDPKLPTMPQVFRNAGYQAYAVGKMHVYPQRNRIGFDDVILNEEGRHHLSGVVDDFERFLAEEGYAGQELTHAMGTNEYVSRAWHLPEHCHPTNWTVREMCRTIRRRDPTRPAFWYCSFIGPHPPVTPPREYLDMYRHIGVDDPFIGDWARDSDDLPYALKFHRHHRSIPTDVETRLAREAFFAQCTYIDHQLRLVIGTLREEKLLDNTVILMTGDHGDMCGNHGLWAKPPMLEWSAKVPMHLIGTAGDDRVPAGRPDDRLVLLRDVMPTLLDLCHIPIPETVEGRSLLADERRDHIYCEHFEDDRAMRMVRDDRYKLIWYPVGNRFQFFDLQDDPQELRDLANDPHHADTRKRLTESMASELYGTDTRWLKNDTLLGEPDKPYVHRPNRGFAGQRGWR